MTVVFILGTILFFLGLDWAHRKLNPRTVVQHVPVQAVGTPRVPEGIFFTKSHTWLNLFPSGKVRLGIDDFVSSLVGKPEVTLLREAGTPVRKGDAIARLQSGSHSLTVFAPIDGNVVDVNRELTERPGMLSDSTFNDGWMYTIIPQRISDLKVHLLGTETHAWMRNEFRRLRDFFAVSEAQLVPAVMQDGGMPVSGVLQSMDEDAWQSFQESFMKPE
jgi:glycine cleavage system H protein